MRYLLSIDVPESAAGHAITKLNADGAVARVARVRNGVANIDFLFKKGATNTYVPGATLNSVRKYKFNDKTFTSKGLKSATKTVWS